MVPHPNRMQQNKSLWTQPETYDLLILRNTHERAGKKTATWKANHIKITIPVEIKSLFPTSISTGSQRSNNLVP